jgi:hypothetical protein
LTWPPRHESNGDGSISVDGHNGEGASEALTGQPPAQGGCRIATHRRPPWSSGHSTGCPVSKPPPVYTSASARIQPSHHAPCRQPNPARPSASTLVGGRHLAASAATSYISTLCSPGTVVKDSQTNKPKRPAYTVLLVLPSTLRISL